jgi:hypothetical protein
MSFFTELFDYMRARKKFLLVIFGGLIILAKGSAVAPLIYTIF